MADALRTIELSGHQHSAAWYSSGANRRKAIKRIDVHAHPRTNTWVMSRTIKK